MEKQLARVAVAQVILIVYVLLSAAVFLKIRYGTSHPIFVNDAPYGSYVIRLKGFGLWLLLIPAVWSFCCFWRMRKPASDDDTFTTLYFSGLIVAVALFFLGLSTASVFVDHLVHVKKEPRPGITGPHYDVIKRADKP